MLATPITHTLLLILLYLRATRLTTASEGDVGYRSAARCLCGAECDIMIEIILLGE